MIELFFVVFNMVFFSFFMRGLISEFLWFGWFKISLRCWLCCLMRIGVFEVIGWWFLICFLLYEWVLVDLLWWSVVFDEVD